MSRVWGPPCTGLAVCMAGALSAFDAVADVVADVLPGGCIHSNQFFQRHLASTELTEDCHAAPPGCTVTFAYRDPVARAYFEALRDLYRACPDLVTAQKDPPVNHPDSYDAWTFRYKTWDLRLTLKDKAQLQQTFVRWDQVPSAD